MVSTCVHAATTRVCYLSLQVCVNTRSGCVYGSTIFMFDLCWNGWMYVMTLTGFKL